MEPQQLFLDPSHTYRLWLDRYQPASQPPKGLHVQLLNRREDANKVHRLYVRRHMVPPDAEFIWGQRASQILTYLVATDAAEGRVKIELRLLGDPEPVGG